MQDRRLVGAIAQTEGDRDPLDAAVRQWQRLGVGDHQADVASQATGQGAVATHGQHGGVDVGQQHRTAAAAQPAEADIAGAAGQVQQGVLGARPQVVDEDLLPQPVHAE